MKNYYQLNLRFKLWYKTSMQQNDSIRKQWEESYPEKGPQNRDIFIFFHHWIYNSQKEQNRRQKSWNN